MAIGVFVNDGAAQSPTYALHVSVSAGSDVEPVIIGQARLETDEDTPLTVTLADLVVDDPDSQYPDAFTLTLMPGADYVLLGDGVLQPTQDYNGVLSVPVVVNDGSSNSAPYMLAVNVLPVNDAPTITGQAVLRAPRNAPIVLSLTDLTVVDVDGGPARCP